MARGTTGSGETTVNLRIDAVLKEDFAAAAAAEQQPASEVLRNLMRSYVEEARHRRFLSEARRQSQLIANSKDETEVMRWIQDVSADRERAMKRGDLVTVAVSGDYGKPRPALVVQADAFDLHPSFTVLPLTSELHDAPLFRILVETGKESGLRAPSQVMVDKATTVPRSKIGARIGHLNAETMRIVDRALRDFLGL